LREKLHCFRKLRVLERFHTAIQGIRGFHLSFG
jgi:hypothetical protein